MPRNFRKIAEYQPIDGIPLTPAFDGKPLGRERPIFIEHENNASVRDGEWKLVGKGAPCRAASGKKSGSITLSARTAPN